MTLPKGQKAAVFANGVAEVFSSNRQSVEYRAHPLGSSYDDIGTPTGMPDRAHMLADLAKGPATPFEAGRVIVVFRPGSGPTQDVESVSPTELLLYRNAHSPSQRAASTPAYSASTDTNALLARIGADRLERLFRSIPQSSLSTLRASAQARVGHPLLAFENAYRIHITAAGVRDAVSMLQKSQNVEYASPDWHVTTMLAQSIPIPRSVLNTVRQMPRSVVRSSTGRVDRIRPDTLPTNYALTSSEQSMLNTPSLDDAAAYDLIKSSFHQLPGQGMNITNVSIGDLDDASAASNPNDRCNFWASVFGPTSEIVSGQRYINWPSMPLIAAFTSDSSGNLSGTGEVCGVDPFLGEVGLDFSMMAPLPDPLQRSGESGSGLTDLLGIAPGATFHLVVPGSSNPTFSDIDASFLGAVLQSPRPDVITASLGFGVDVFGFSGRYLEDDPLTLSIVTSIVHNYNTVVCISSGDGTRLFTTAAIGPSGGTVPTNLVPAGGQPTNITDVEFSGVPSLDFDSGSIDVGGTTLDDIFASPPQHQTRSLMAMQHAWAETRWTGFTSFSSGFGSRVNVSAPSDNVIGFSHTFGGTDDAVDVNLSGGTSASAPETAAAAAVVLQIGRLTGHPFASAIAVRDFLASTGNAVPNVLQADTNLNIGPQVDLGRAVTKLLHNAGMSVTPNVARVAIQQRRNFGDLDGAFVGFTDPTNIDLQGPVSSADGTNTDRDRRAWITLAPDWEGIPAGARYSLFVAGSPTNVIAATPWARLQPADILHAAGLPVVSSTSRTVMLTYAANLGMSTLASATFSLTFGPCDATTRAVLAPRVPELSTGPMIPVTYDLTDARNVSNPTLLVSQPGRVDPATGFLFHPAYTAPLGSLKGTVMVPTSALRGGGIYGIGILFGFVNTSPLYSDFAFTRYAPAGANRAPAPTLAINGSAPGHFLEIPYGSSFQLSWDVSSVPGATGAAVEVSAAGPTAFGIYNPFNNPNGTVKDANGFDSGSVHYGGLPGLSGTTTLNGLSIGLIPTMNHVVRVIPVGAGGRAGEGGDVSTITMDGVRPADGGFVNNGYGISERATDAFLSSGQLTASGQILSSVETFDESTNAISQTVASASSGDIFFTNGWGIYGKDVGLYGDSTSTGSTFNLLNPVATGTIGAAWTPPSNLFVTEGAANQVNDKAAFEAFDFTGSGNDTFREFTSKITANTFGTIYDVSGPITGFGLPVIFGFGENTTKQRGIAVAGDFFNFCGSPTIIETNLTNGTTTSFTGLGAGVPFGLGVDSTTNKAAIPTICDNGLSIYNLATNSGSEVILPGSNGLYTMPDQTRGLFLVEETVAADLQTNNNSLSNVLVYDESGNLLKTQERFFLYNAFLTINANNLQLNTNNRKGYMFGPFTAQLEPFAY